MATSQELEAENVTLKAENTRLHEAVEYYHEAKEKADMEQYLAEQRCENVEKELAAAKRDLTHFKKTYLKKAAELDKARDERYALEDRIRKGMRKALHPDWPDTEDEEDKESGPERSES